MQNKYWLKKVMIHSELKQKRVKIFNMNTVFVFIYLFG